MSHLAVVSPETATGLLYGRLRKLRRRLRALLGVRVGAMGVAVVAGAFALVILWLRLKGIWYLPMLPEIALAGVCLLAAVAALVWPLSDHTVAVSADRRLDLRDRLSTAVALSASPQPSGMHEAAVVDAAETIRGFRPRDVYPLRLYPWAKPSLFCVAGLLLSQFLPIPALLVPQKEREERAELRKRAVLIKPVARKLEREAREAEDPEAKELARRLRKLAQQFQRGTLSKKQAILSMKDLQAELKELAKEESSPAPKTAAKAAEELKKATKGRMASQAKDLAKRAAARGDREAERSLNELAEQAKRAQSADVLKALGARLKRQAAKAGQTLPIPPELAAELAKALENENLQAALEKLAELEGALDKAADELTKEEIEELIKQLEELAKILKDTDLDELAKALEEAAECLKQGDCKGAKAALGKGCKAAAGKCASLKVAKAATEASACLGGMGAAGSRGPGQGMVRATQGGQGVGPDSHGQDGSPIDSPAAQLYAPRETPTEGDRVRVPGQVRAAGDMLVTEEKGAPDLQTESRTPYYEVIGDYSRAAEEALSREEVPPAYKATVRAYFDSLQPAASAPAPEGEPEDE